MGIFFNAETVKTDNPDLQVGCPFYWLLKKHFELVNPSCTKEIHVSVEGNTVHAVMKEDGKIIKRSKAICSKEDEFDFRTGTELAVIRLFEEDKSKFTPFLQCDRDYEFCGQIGKKTIYKDDHGLQLFVGDVVKIIKKGSSNSAIAFVCEDANYPLGFIWGILWNCHPDGIVDGWEVHKIKDFSVLENLESINGVTAILEEKIKCK